MVEAKAELFRFRRVFFFSVRAKTCKARRGRGGVSMSDAKRNIL